MSTMTTGQAAERLGITQVAVRKLIRTGQLVQAGTVGRLVLVDSASVDLLARIGTRHGRPWTEANAWAALCLLSGRAGVDWVGSSELSRLRERLRAMDGAELPILARRRAVVHRFRGTEDVVRELHDHLLLTGAAAMSDDEIGGRFGLTAGAGTADGYARAGDADALRSAYGLIEDREGNVVIREVTVTQAFSGGVVPLAAIALDLLESPAARERSAGRRVIKELMDD